MTGRTEEIRQQVKRAVEAMVVQVEGVAGPLARTVAEKLDLDRDKLVTQRNVWLGRLSAESARLAEQEAVPLPRVVKDALGRVHDVIGAIVDHDAPPAQAKAKAKAEAAEPVVTASPAATKSKPRARKAHGGAGKAAGASKRTRKRPPKSSH